MEKPSKYHIFAVTNQMITMKYQFNKKSEKWKSINNVDEWVKSFDPSKNDEDGKSAKTLAQFCKENDVESIIKEWIAPIVKEEFSLDSAMPEMSTKFDNYGKGRTHDLGIYGKTVSGKRIFIGVEAKVNETFGGTVQSAYDKVAYLKSVGKNSNLDARIEGLKKKYFPGLDLDDIRYQLLYAIAGTLCEEAVIKILLFITIETSQFKVESGLRNDNDLNDFLKLLDIEIIPENCWKLNFGEQTMCVLNKHVKVNYENR